MIEINIKKRQKKTIPRTTEMGKNHHYAADKNRYKKPVQFDMVENYVILPVKPKGDNQR